MAFKIDTVAARGRLKSRREPYWHKISKGCYLGYWKSNKGSTWRARSFNEATKKQDYLALGDFATLPDNERFDAASKAARAWFEHLGKGGSAESRTVSEACASYVRSLRASKGDAAADEAEGRFRRHVLSDSVFASCPLTKLTPTHFDAWRQGLRGKPAATGKNKGGKRTESAINRDINSLRAALNLAVEDGFVVSDRAWRAKLAPSKNADRRREVYLDKDQRRMLVQAASPDIAKFLRALSQLPLRPGAMAKLLVGMYDARLKVLTVGHDKVGAGRKLLISSDDTAALFDASCNGRPADAPIFANSAGSAWDKDSWGYQVQQAAKRSDMPSGTTAYSIRHSVITDMIKAGLDTMWVANYAGTSASIIQKHYYHLTHTHAKPALASLVL